MQAREQETLAVAYHGFVAGLVDLQFAESAAIGWGLWCFCRARVPVWQGNTGRATPNLYQPAGEHLSAWRLSLNQKKVELISKELGIHELKGSGFISVVYMGCLRFR